MHSRNKKRPTYDVIVDNLPLSVTDTELNKIFTEYGEIRTINIRKVHDHQQARIKYLCEPDANLVVEKYNGFLLKNNIITAKKAAYEHKETAGKMGYSKARTGPFRKHEQMQSGMRLSATEMSLKNMDYAIMDCKQSTSSASVTSFCEEREITCTYVENAVTFYGHCTSMLRTIEELGTILQQCCPYLPRLRKTPDYKKVYGAVYSGDKQWYRCRVMKNGKTGKSFVQYIDFGNYEEVSYTMMVELPDDLKNYPCMAPKCTLSSVSIVPDKRDDYSSLQLQAVDFLQQIMLGRVVSIMTKSPEKSLTYEVTRCICNGVDIIQCLIEKGFVVPKSAQPRSDTQSILKKLYKQEKDSQFCLPVADTKVSTHSVSSSHASNSWAVMKERDDLKAKVTELEEKLKVMDKELAQRNELKYAVVDKLERMVTKLQAVNRNRKQPQNWSYVTQVLDLLQSVTNNGQLTRRDLGRKIEESSESYKKIISSIVCCQDKTELDNLVLEKETVRTQLCNYLSEYVRLPANVDEAMINVLQATAANLKCHLNTNHDIVLEEKPSSLSELIEACKNILVPEASVEVQEKTNAAHAVFLKEFSRITKAFLLHGSVFDETVSNCVKQLDYGAISEKIFSSQSLFESVKSLEQALDEEMKILSPGASPKHSSSHTVVKFLLKEINLILDEHSKHQLMIQNHSALLEKITSSVSPKDLVSDLTRVKKNIKTIKSKLRHILVDKKDLEETDVYDQAAMVEVDNAISGLLKDLHDAFVLEDYNMKNLAILYRDIYPELDFQYPELGLAKYVETKGIFKQGWEADHFRCEKLHDHFGDCSKAVFCNEPVILKELLLDSEEKSKELIDRALMWNTFSGIVMPVSAIFRKGERQVYVMTTYMDTVGQLHDLSFERSISIVSKVLSCLASLHSSDLVHGAIHSSSVLVDGESLKLDFCFDPKQYLLKCSQNGINYLPPELTKGCELSKASDMYTFGCFALSMLFPNLHFEAFPEGSPNISRHKNTIESLLSPSDYSVLSSLVSSNFSLRASAESIMKMNFLNSSISPVPSVLCKSLSVIDDSKSVENSKDQEVIESSHSDDPEPDADDTAHPTGIENVTYLSPPDATFIESIAEVPLHIQNHHLQEGIHFPEEIKIASPVDPRTDGTLKKLFALRQTIKCPAPDVLVTSELESDLKILQVKEDDGGGNVENDLDTTPLIPAPVDPELVN